MKSNNIFFKTLLAGVTMALLFTQCKDDDATGYSTLQATSPTLSVDWTAPSSLVETNVDYPFTVTLSEPQVVDVKVNVTVEDGGTATEGSDFALSSSVITIPAFTTSGTGTLSIFEDNDIEGQESFTVTVGGGVTANYDATPQSYTVTLENLVANEITAIIDWSGSQIVEGIERDFCTEVDLDLYIYDATMMDSGNYDSATGDCPEDMTISNAAFGGDGTYYLVASNYINNIRPTDGTVVSYPMTVTLTRAGSYVDFVLPPVAGTTFTSSDPDFDTDGVFNEFYMYKVEIVGDTFKFYDYNTNTLLLEG